MNRIMAYTFTGRELHLIGKALHAYITEYERGQEDGKKLNPSAERFYAKEHDDMVKLYQQIY